LKIFAEYENVERIVTPLFKTLDFIFELDVVLKWAKESGLGYDLFGVICREIKETKSISKVFFFFFLFLIIFINYFFFFFSFFKIPAAIGLIVSLIHLQTESIRTDLLELILSLLIHKFPKVRKATSDKLYLLIMSSGD
jgi:hypothetical protein